MEARGRTAAADALGVNYRTVVANLEAGRLSRRMRTAVQRFEREEAAEAEEQAETVEQRMEALLGEVRQIRETMEA